MDREESIDIFAEDEQEDGAEGPVVGATQGSRTGDDKSLFLSSKSLSDCNTMSLNELQSEINKIEDTRMTRFDSAFRQMSKVIETTEEIWVRRVHLCLQKLTSLDPMRKQHKANLYR